MKMKLIAVLSVVLCVAGAFAASNADYVQDGLVTHFDAIDNEGTGTHNASATKWKDLKGSASITLVSGASWGGGNYLNTTTTRHPISNMPSYNRGSVTVEAAVDVTETGMSSTKKWPRIFADGQYFSVHYTYGRNDLCLFMCSDSGSGAAEGRVYSQPPLFSSGTVVGFSGSDGYGIAIDGKVVTNRTQSTSVAMQRAANASWSLNAYEGPLSGHYHALRVYNRKLNAEELLQNAIVDKVRYWNTYPTGYRDSGGVLQKRVLVAKPTGCVLEVDGVAQAGDFEDWSAFGTRATYTLTATPESGYQFQRWAGDMDCITSGNLYSNTITVARSLAMSFTPVFTAIPEPVLASPVYTITVASGTRELTTAVDDDNTAIGTTGTIVKKGAGTLQIKSDVISTFAGEIVIEAGRWYSGTRSGLGTKNGGAVWVKNGATLHMFHGEKHNFATADQITRKAYIIGTGTDGKGALYGSSGLGGSTEVYGIYPKYITLLGDARIESADHVNFDNLVVDMNRHTFTVSPKDSDWDRLSGTWTNGNINVVSKPILIEGSPVLAGGDENVIRFKSSSGYRANNYAATENNAQGRWTAVFENNTTLYGPNKSGVIAGWNGPVILEGNTAITCQDTFGKFAFWGPVSGPGNFGKNTTAVKYTNLKLANANNSFTGGIWVKWGSLTATTDGAIPANGGAVNATNSTVELSAAMEYHLPGLVLSGTGSVFSVAGTTGSFKNATKTGGDTITWNTKVGAKSFALNGGTLKFGTVPVANGVVQADFGAFSAARGTTLDLSGNAWTCTNLTGAATLVDGALTVNGPWTLDAANAGTLGGGTATVAFGPNALLTLANASGLSRAQVYTIATTAATYSAPPALDADALAAHWRVRVSSDGKSLELYNASGMTIILR